MMLLKNGGGIVISDDPNLINAVMLPNSRILSMDETGIFDPNSPLVIQATCLLPPPEALMAEIDGRATDFSYIYTNYLMSDVVMEFMAVVLSSIYMGYQLILYAPSSSDSIWISVLINHFVTIYGLTPGTIGQITTPCIYNDNFNTYNSEILYAVGVMDGITFLTLHSYQAPIPKPILDKLVRELNPAMTPGMSPFDAIMNMKFSLQSNNARQNLQVAIRGCN